MAHNPVPDLLSAAIDDVFPSYARGEMVLESEDDLHGLGGVLGLTTAGTDLRVGGSSRGSSHVSLKLGVRGVQKGQYV